MVKSSSCLKVDLTLHLNLSSHFYFRLSFQPPLTLDLQLGL